MLRVRIDGGALTTEQLRVIGEISRRLRPRHRRHHRPAERPAALDPDRGRPGDLAPARGGRPVTPPRPAATRPRVILGSPVAGIAADEIIDGTPGHRRDRRALHRRPGVLQPAPQVQDRDLRAPAATTWRTRSTTSPSSASTTPSTAPASTSGSAAACPPTRCSASAARRLGPAGRGRRGLGRRRRDLPRLRLPPAAHPRPAEVPGRRLGRRRSSARCWRTSTCSARSLDGPAPAAARRSSGDHVGVHRAEGRPLLRRLRRRRRPGRRQTPARSSPTSPRPTAPTGCAPPPSRR